MRRAAVIAAAALMSLAAAPAQRVSELGWLSGAWVSETRDGWTEESWTAPRGGMMLGTSRSGKGGKATWFEYMRIAEDGRGKVSFWALPGGKPAVEFQLTASGRRHATFENARHDYPTRVSYRRQGNRLLATISGAGGANPTSWTFRRR